MTGSRTGPNPRTPPAHSRQSLDTWPFHWDRPRHPAAPSPTVHMYVHMNRRRQTHRRAQGCLFTTGLSFFFAFDSALAGRRLRPPALDRHPLAVNGQGLIQRRLRVKVRTSSLYQWHACQWVYHWSTSA